MYIEISNTKVWFQRLSFVGELGWEIYIPIKKTKIIFEKIKKLGKKYNLTYSGMHALDILRLEKNSYIGAMILLLKIIHLRQDYRLQ